MPNLGRVEYIYAIFYSRVHDMASAEKLQKRQIKLPDAELIDACNFFSRRVLSHTLELVSARYQALIFHHFRDRPLLVFDRIDTLHGGEVTSCY